MTKVLHVYRTYFPDPPGGLQEAIRQICMATQPLGIESRIFTLSPNPFPRIVRSAEGDIVRSKSWAAPASCDLGGLDAIRQFRALSKWGDIIHYHFPWPFADLLRLFSAHGKPSVMTYHSDIMRQRNLAFFYRPLLRRTIRSMSAVVATSPAYARTSPVLTTLVRGDRLRIIPLGIVDTADNDNAQSAVEGSLQRFALGDEPFFLSLGVLRYYKGLHTLIEAAACVNAKVVIAGSGPESDRLKALAKHAGVSNVVFVGQISDEEKAALLSRCKAFVFPSHLRSEAFGMALVEAAMYGRPMVSCEIGSGTSYVNEHEVTGLVVPPESPRQLAVAMNTLLSDDALAGRMGMAARQRYERLFSGSVLGKLYRELYCEILGAAV